VGARSTPCPRRAPAAVSPAGQLWGGSRAVAAPQRRRAAHAGAVLPSRAGKNFIAENRVAAAAAPRPVKAESRKEPGQEYLVKRDYGRRVSARDNSPAQHAAPHPPLAEVALAEQLQAGSGPGPPPTAPRRAMHLSPGWRPRARSVGPCRVPQYLLERKVQMAADYEAQLAAKEAALIPPGEGAAAAPPAGREAAGKPAAAQGRGTPTPHCRTTGMAAWL